VDDPMTGPPSTVDSLGRVTSVLSPDGATVATEYRGAEVTVTDQAGRKRRSVSDALGRLEKVVEAPGAADYGYEKKYDPRRVPLALFALRRAGPDIADRGGPQDREEGTLVTIKAKVAARPTKQGCALGAAPRAASVTRRSVVRYRSGRGDSPIRRIHALCAGSLAAAHATTRSWYVVLV
jgi:hypothetical protein